MAQLYSGRGSLEAIKVLQFPTDHTLHAGTMKHEREPRLLVQVCQADPINTPLRKIEEEASE
jgi:hypothetical protein